MFDRSYLPAADFEFVVIGDTHYILDAEIYASAGDSQDVSYTREWSARAEHALQLAAALETDFVVHLGGGTLTYVSPTATLLAKQGAFKGPSE